MPRSTPEPAALRTVAPAKINWTLEVLGRRPDGYHEVRSVMQTISLADELDLRPASAFSLEITGREAGGLKARDNLVTRAVHALPDLARERPVAIRLEKAIPAAAGLGGGSSDAAATLRLLAKHWSIEDRDVIQQVAVSLGSDVSFFLRGGMQLAQGRGELVSPLPVPDAVTLVLITPPIVVADKTRRLYSLLRPHHYTDGERTLRLVERLKQGRMPTRDDYFNVFDAVADQVYPGLPGYRETLQRITGEEPMLAGAGPSLFVIVPAARTNPYLSAAMEGRGLSGWAVATTELAPPRHNLLVRPLGRPGPMG
jgi:4-diphosphocytidyl-2-C-methyl-D-erythritol kinase